MLIVSVIPSPRPNDTDTELVDDCIQVANMAISDAGGDAVELNISCVTALGRERTIQENLALLEEVCKQVRRAVGTTPILLKIAPCSRAYLGQIVHATHQYVDGYTAVNSMAVDPVLRGDQNLEDAMPRAEDASGGHAASAATRASLSGQLILQVGLRTVRELAALRTREGHSYAIVGVGGVNHENDVLLYEKAGADVVQAANVFFTDPLFALRVRRHLLADREGEESFHSRQRREALSTAFATYGELAEEGHVGLLPAVFTVLAEWEQDQLTMIKAGPRKAFPVPSQAEFKRRVREKLRRR
jgi:dihydroorotate dehydrogenase